MKQSKQNQTKHATQAKKSKVDDAIVFENKRKQRPQNKCKQNKLNKKPNYSETNKACMANKKQTNANNAIRANAIKNTHSKRNNKNSKTSRCNQKQRKQSKQHINKSKQSRQINQMHTKTSQKSSQSFTKQTTKPQETKQRNAITCKQHQSKTSTPLTETTNQIRKS